MKKRTWFYAALSFASLAWLVLRTGRKPSRLRYPCQQAALANSALALSLLGAGAAGIMRGSRTAKLRRFWAVPLILSILVLVSTSFGTSPVVKARGGPAELPDLQQAQARAAFLQPPVFEAASTNQTTATSASTTHDVFWVSHVPPYYGGQRHAGVDALVKLLGEGGVDLYKSDKDYPGAGPGGLISSNDVVLVKVNLAYDQRGMTNVDVAQGIITALLSHPDGFTGEVVAVENCEGGLDFDLYNVNCEDIHRTYRSMIDSYGDPSRVSCSSWYSFTDNAVGEFNAGDYDQGYIPIGSNVSYPKFVTGRGTCVSLKYGIWDGASYDRSRLKLINVPVLKSHSSLGATAAVKHFMGVPSIHMTTDVHNDLMVGGFMGRMMNETVYPCLNIIDAIWTSPSHPTGPAAPYGLAVRTDMLLASTDPVVLDWYACKYVLYAVSGYGRHDPDCTWDETSNPYHDGTRSYGYPYDALRLMLVSNAAALRAGGRDVTLDPSKMTVHARDMSIPLDGGHCVTGAAQPAGDWYFAEGTTREGFDAWACLQNPGAAAARATLYFQTATGAETTYDADLPARSRVTLHLNHFLGPGMDFSFRVRADAPIVAERPMYFLYQGAWSGGSDVLGAPAPRAEWYFAEGCTRNGFDTWLCLQNPGATGALVDIDYHCGDGTTVSKAGVTVPALTRFTIPVHDPALGVGRHDSTSGDVSIHLRSTNGVPIVAERPMYFLYQGAWSGGSDVLGAPAPRAEWYFAEGCTRNGFDTWLCLQNPGATGALVDIDYHCGDGTTVSKAGVTVPALTRFTIPVHDPALGVGRHDSTSGDVSIHLRSTNGVPIVAERPMYFSR